MALVTATFGGRRFERICALEPQRNGDGDLLTYVPESATCNTRTMELHAYGAGPFCRFRIPDHCCGRRGVYVLTLDSVVVYVGQCVDLRQRFNMGYGAIQPRNRFAGGQPTNCRLNHLVLDAVSGGRLLELWFHATDELKRIEREMGRALRPIWNRTSWDA